MMLLWQTGFRYPLFVELTEQDEDDQAPRRPEAESVATRAIILSVVSCRAFTSQEPENSGAASLAKKSYEWLRAIGLDESLTEWERQILTAPFGSLKDRDIIDGSWLSEAVNVLAWALGKRDLPAFDEQCDPAEAADSLGFLQPTEQTCLNKPGLLRSDELDSYNEFIYNLHWRIRDFSLHNRWYNCSNLFAETARKYGLKIIDHDLCISGKPISDSAEADWRPVLSITRERHRASNWLVGYDSEDFYEVGTDT